MTTRTIEDFSPPQTTAALAFGSAGLIILGVQPIILGQLVSSGHVDLDGVGLIAMAEIIFIGVGVGLAPALFSLNRFRTVALLASTVVAGANVASTFSGGFGDLIAVRLLAGLGTGVLVWVSSSLIVRVRNAERIAGVFLASQTLAQAAVAALLALLIVPSGGWQWGFLTLAVIVLLPNLTLFVLPATMLPLTEENTSLPPFSVGVLLASLIVISQMAIVGSLWTFIEPISVAAGLEPQSVQLVISWTLFMQAIGGACAAYLVTHLDARLMLGIGGVCQCAIAYFFGHSLTDSLPVFVLVCAVFGFLWLFLMPFHVRMALRVDPSGRLALIGAALQLLGSALGPLVASTMIQGDDATPAATASAGFAALSVVMLLVLTVVETRPVLEDEQRPLPEGVGESGP